MATKKTSSQDVAPLILHSRADLMASSAAMLVGQVRTEEQAEILGKVETDFLRQRAVVARELHGQQLITRGAEAAAHRYVGFVNKTEALRQQVQGKEARHKLEIFLNQLEEDHGNALRDTHYLAEERVQEIVASPVDPTEWQEEDYEEEVPNLFQRIFGGCITSKRVRR